MLAKCFLVLANSGIFSAALIKRDGELSQNGDVGRPKFLRYRLVTLRIGSSEPKIRIKRGLADFHRELGNVNAVHRRQYRRTLRLASGNCSRQRRWGQPIDRCAWRKPARIDPDDSAVIRLRSDVIRLCLKKLRTSCSEARFGLRDVSARHFADIEPVTRLFQSLGKHFDVAAMRRLRSRIAWSRIKFM